LSGAWVVSAAVACIAVFRLRGGLLRWGGEAMSGGLPVGAHVKGTVPAQRTRPGLDHVDVDRR
jgi:hypothetical protein